MTNGRTSPSLSLNSNALFGMTAKKPDCSRRSNYKKNSSFITNPPLIRSCTLILTNLFFSISINLFYFSIEQGLLQKKFQLKSIWCFSLDLLLFFFLLFIFSQSLSVSLSFRAKINCHRKMSLLNIFNHFE